MSFSDIFTSTVIPAEPIPPGSDYRLRITGVGERTAATGTRMLTVDFIIEVVTPGCEATVGGVVREAFPMSGSGMTFLIPLLNALDLKANAVGWFPLGVADLVGRSILADLEEETYEGEKRIRVRRIRRASSTPSLLPIAQHHSRPLTPPPHANPTGGSMITQQADTTFARSNDFYVPGSTPDFPDNVCHACLRIHASTGSAWCCEHVDGQFRHRRMTSDVFDFSCIGGVPEDARFSAPKRERYHHLRTRFIADRLDDADRLTPRERAEFRRLDNEARGVQSKAPAKKPKSPPPVARPVRTTRTRARGQHRAATNTPPKAKGGSDSGGDGDGDGGGGEDDHQRVRLVAVRDLVPPPRAAEYSATYTSVGDVGVRQDARARVTQVLSDLLRRP